MNRRLDWLNAGGGKRANTVAVTIVAVVVVAAVVFIMFFFSGRRQYAGTGYMMGAYVRVTVYGSDCTAEALAAVNDCESRLSHRIAGSETAMFNNGETFEQSQQFRDIMELSASLKELTDGAFDTGVLRLTSLWDFDSGKHVIPDDEPLREAVAAVAAGNGGLDLGSVGKGAACDSAAAVLKDNGASGVVAVGGSLACVGEKPGGGDWNINVRDPFGGASDTLLTLSLGECFISTSGSYEKFFITDGELYHHILDPRTGMPAVSDIVSVTVIAGSGALSDALSTAMFVVGEERALELCEFFDAEALFVHGDGSITATDGLLGSINASADTEISYEAGR